MNKIDFLEFYNGVVKKLGVHLENEYRQFHFAIILIHCMKNISIKRPC